MKNKKTWLWSQAVCEWGRESVESWGKRRRRSLANATEEKAEDMTLSQEILVLDFGDEKQSDFLKSDASIDFNEAGNYMNSFPITHSSLFIYITSNKREKEIISILFPRQNGDHCGALSNKDLGVNSGRDVCPACPYLHFHDLLLLHEEMVVTPQNDALKITCRGPRLTEYLSAGDKRSEPGKLRIKCKLTTRRTCYKTCTRWTRETRVRVDAWKNYDFAPSFSILLTFRAKHWFQEAEPCKKRPFFRADYTVRTYFLRYCGFGFIAMLVIGDLLLFTAHQARTFKQAIELIVIQISSDNLQQA